MNDEDDADVVIIVLMRMMMMMMMMMIHRKIIVIRIAILSIITRLIDDISQHPRSELYAFSPVMDGQ